MGKNINIQSYKLYIIPLLLILTSLLYNYKVEDMYKAEFAKEAERLNHLLEQASNGDPESQYSLARSFEEGGRRFSFIFESLPLPPEKINLEKALYWYTQSAQQDYIPALFKYGEIYEFGQLNVEQSNSQALAWYTSASKDGEFKARIKICKIHANEYHEYSVSERNYVRNYCTLLSEEYENNLPDLIERRGEESLELATSFITMELSDKVQMQFQKLSQKSTEPSAICNDGTYSYSLTRQGTCSHHGGVSIWY